MAQKETKQETKDRKVEEKKVLALASTDRDNLPTRGRTFQGFVTKKFPKRVVIEFERTVFIKKYERFFKKKTKLHARLPDAMANDINVGDYIKIKETRPLSKIIHFLVLQKLRAADVKPVKAVVREEKPTKSKSKSVKAEKVEAQA